MHCNAFGLYEVVTQFIHYIYLHRKCVSIFHELIVPRSFHQITIIREIEKRGGRRGQGGGGGGGIGYW